MYYPVFMASFPRTGSIAEFQTFINDVYGLPDDRMFSIFDLLSNVERFTMRAIKGIRKDDEQKLAMNLVIAFSWFMAVANRLHINTEEALWKRFPNMCSYCAACPCECKTTKRKVRKRIAAKSKNRPKTLEDFQRMLARIYPPRTRTLADAGLHLAEETGEVSEAISVFLGEHKPEQFKRIPRELADYISCLFGVANSAKLNVARILAAHYRKNCHACHKIPCACGFSYIAKFDS
jgi:NTP pyrophosphatase (non-canonical NTP hydrolase)